MDPGAIVSGAGTCEAGIDADGVGGPRGEGQLVCTNGQGAWSFLLLNVSNSHWVTPAMVAGLRTSGYGGETMRPLLVRKVGCGAEPIGMCLSLNVGGEGGEHEVFTLRRPWDDTVAHLIERMERHLQKRRTGGRRMSQGMRIEGGEGGARAGASQPRAHKTTKADAEYVRQVKGDLGMSGEEQAAALKAYFTAKVIAERAECVRSGEVEDRPQIALYEPGTLWANGGGPGPGGWGRGKRAGDERLVREVLVEGAVLEVNGAEYLVRVNTPVACAPYTLGVDTIVGCPLAPAVACEFCCEGELEWKWSRVRLDEAGHVKEGDGVEIVGRKRIYTPCMEDLGSILRVSARPPSRAETAAANVYPLGQDGGGFETQFERPVELPAGSRDPVLNRIAALERMAERCAPDSLRVMSYNVLADSLNSINKSLFPHTPPRILSREYRLPILASEIADFDADLVLLQEIDWANWERFWAVHFRERGFAGFFTPKTGLDALNPSVGDESVLTTRTASEGCAMLWRESKLRMVDTRDISFCEASVAALEGKAWGSGSSDKVKAPNREWVSDFVKVIPNLERVLKGVSSVAQLAVLQPVADGVVQHNRRLLVTNSHFFYHRDACHVRAIQAKLLVDEVERTIKEIKCMSPGAQVGLCLAGDFNAKRHSLAMEFFLESAVKPSRKRWADCAHFAWNANVTFNEGEPMLDTSPNSSQSLKMRMKNMTVKEAMAYADLALEENEKGNSRLLNDAIKHFKRMLRHVRSNEGGVDLRKSMRKKERQLLKALRADVAKASFHHAALNGEDLDRGLETGKSSKVPVRTEENRNDAKVVGLGLHLSHGLDLKLAGEPLPYTNWVRGFRESIDWILIGNKEILCRAWAPSPIFSTDNLHENGLPSGTFPSDHISVVAQLEWRSTEGNSGVNSSQEYIR